MKYLFAYIILECIYSSTLFAQTEVGPPNADLEQWTALPGYDEPVGWQTLNAFVGLLAPATVSKVTDAAQGAYAARLETKQFITFLIPGLMYLGSFDLSEGVNGAKYGIPFAGGNPVSFRGSYKYLPVSGDSAAISAQLWGRNPITGARDTIAEAQYAVTQTSTSYLTFDLPFQYSSNIVPDSVSVVLVSSAGAGDGGLGQIGSALYIDNLSFSYNSGIEQPLLHQPPHKVYIAQQRLIAETNAYSVPYNLDLYDLQGKLIRQWQFDEARIEADIADLPAGVYAYRLINQELQQQVSGIVSITK